MKRIFIDIILFLATLLLFVLHNYITLPAPLQLLAFKAMLVSAGILHAHIARKLLFPRVNWSEFKMTGLHYVTIAFYIIIIYAYSIGG